MKEQGEHGIDACEYRPHTFFVRATGSLKILADDCVKTAHLLVALICRDISGHLRPFPASKGR